jgi:hypothetical protein
VEKRAIALPLLLVLLVNVGVYVLVVHPLAVKSAGAADRAAAAVNALRAAEGELAAARALVGSKTQAEQELRTFYDRVLPASLAAARRMTYARLPALARKSDVRYEQRSFEVEQGLNDLKDARFGRLHIRMVLQGEYESLRRFVYELETAPEFVILDDVALAQVDPSKPLTLTLELSTYYRTGANGI